mmetsp:Transcript_21577/g.66515  ORF Transcript_21577/g.66515 Transcript_21577/m.66515 type:complete len:252 (-) Transcript_21577:306-1061(-)
MIRSTAACSSMVESLYCCLTSSSCSSISGCVMAMAWSLAMCLTASLTRSSRSTTGMTRSRYLSKPSGETIFLSSTSGVPRWRMSASMTANFCLAASLTTSGGSGVLSTRKARTFSISLFVCTIVDPSADCVASPCCRCCCSLAAVTVSSMRRSKAGRVVSSSLATSSADGTTRRRTDFKTTRRRTCLPARDGSRANCAGMSRGTSTTAPCFCPTSDSTTPGRNLPRSRTISRSAPPTWGSSNFFFSSPVGS